MLFVCLSTSRLLLSFFFFFNDTATTEIYTLSLHDALPICGKAADHHGGRSRRVNRSGGTQWPDVDGRSHVCLHRRSEEHTSELQSRSDLVCRLLLEKKKKTKNGKYVSSQSTHTIDISRTNI